MTCSFCDIIDFTKLTETQQFKQQFPQRFNLNTKHFTCTLRKVTGIRMTELDLYNFFLLNLLV